MARPRGFVRLHLIPIFISVILTLLVFMLFPLSSLILPDNTVTDSPVPPEQIPGYFSNFRNSAGEAEREFKKALGDSNTVIFLGSSELSSKELEAIPYRFFNSYLNYPALCIGHAGNQSLNMLSFLAANREYFRKAKIVILVSPTWFVAKAARGTSLESFLEFNSDQFLATLAGDTGLPAATRDYIYHYVALNMDNINAPSVVQKQIAFQYAAGKNWFSALVNAPFTGYYKLLARADGWVRKFRKTAGAEASIPGKNNVPSGIHPSMPADIPWDSLYQSGLEAGRKLSGNNLWGIDSSYYRIHVNGGKFTLSTVPFRFNREFRDFCALLDFLSTANCQPIVVIQPLNPYAYDGLGDYKPLMDQIAKVTGDHHFACLNLFVQDTAQYTKGELKDIMHLGNPGWYKVDHFVIEHFFPEQTLKTLSN